MLLLWTDVEIKGKSIKCHLCANTSREGIVNMGTHVVQFIIMKVAQLKTVIWKFVKGGILSHVTTTTVMDTVSL